MLDVALLRQMMPAAGARLDPHLPFIIPALSAASILQPMRFAAFMAQLAHESGEYRWMEEIADGSAYEGRADLGNVHPGDGRRFKGHGPIQITGRTNHEACGRALGIDLLEQPTLICEPRWATASACWFWNSKRLSLLADRDWFLAITRIVNGGFNGLEDRLRYWRRNRELLGLPPVDVDGETEAIKEFQAERGLVVDGRVGRRTLDALQESVAA
jgi:putative chitinase